MYYDEHITYGDSESKEYLSTIWKAGIVLLVLLILITLHIMRKEYKFYKIGETVVATYYDDETEAVKFYGPDGSCKVRNISRSFIKIVDNQVTLYYINGDINTAKALITVKSWCILWAVYLILGTCFILRIYRIYHPKSCGVKG